MPQCPWFELASGKRIGGTSVQEAIEAVVLPAYGSCTAKMITGGREDADVRMLGAGRPFVLEIQVGGARRGGGGGGGAAWWSRAAVLVPTGVWSSLERPGNKVYCGKGLIELVLQRSRLLLGPRGFGLGLLVSVEGPPSVWPWASPSTRPLEAAVWRPQPAS